MNHANATNNNIKLGFEPLDAVLDEDKPIVYMTQNGSKQIYAVNYETGTVKSLSLPYIAERLAIYKGKLYITQLKFKHSSYNDGSYNGSIAIVDTKD